MLSKRNARLVKRYGGRVIPFRRLPLTAKLALVHYLAVQHEAWPSPEHNDIRLALPFYDAEYGGVKFGIASLPTKALADEIIRDPELAEEYGTFERYHRWYVSHGSMPSHPTTSRWPIILSDFEDETIDDGWHRFHNYYDQGARVVQAIWFA